MKQKSLIYNSHSDDEVCCLAFAKRANHKFDTRIEWISSGDSNVDDPKIREEESREVMTSLLDFTEEQLYFYGFSEKLFYRVLLQPEVEKYFEQILKEIKKVRERFQKFAPDIVLTNFPDGGNARHLFTSWLATNVLASGKERVLGNPKQLYDENIKLGIGHLPAGWLEKLSFAEPADLPEIDLKNGILILREEERKMLEEVCFNPKYYFSQKESNRELFAKFTEGGFREEEIYELEIPIDYQNLNLPTIGFEEFGRRGGHPNVIEFEKHFLPLIQKLENQLDSN